ncbi:mechanosensitive ion channel protein [Pedobacter ginsenosidimutans]|uniref:Mechanosensitive ion channel protein n=2 Tax=Pedobacter ginsenosidimutans TaxID=687842 RepID=A0A0T5VWK4_9SPHI|nr:mechanosensitive ion channel protein [Pedobacter ginsenosidimutans]
MQEFGRRAAIKSKGEFEADKATLAQTKIFDEIRTVMQKAKMYLKTSVDTVGTKAELEQIKKDFMLAGDGVFTNKGTAQTFRNLTATSKIINELLNKAKVRKTGLDLRQQELNNFRYRLDSLSSVPALFKFPTDSLELMGYLKKISVVAYEIAPIDTALKQASGNIQTLLNQVNLEVSSLQVSLDEIDIYQRKMAYNAFGRDFGNIWEPAGFYRPFDEILNFSKIKGLLTLGFYSENNSGKLLILFLLIAISFIYLRSLKRIYTSRELLKADFEGQLVLRYPLASAILLVLSLFQFIFISPPFILSVLLWLISCICLTIIFKGYISKYWLRVWGIMVLFFILAAADNLILQASRTERWFILIAAVIGVVSGLIILLQKKQQELREKWIMYSIGFMVLLEVFAVFANIFGRYNLSKTLFIGGYLNVVIAILFLWVVRFINEGLLLAFDVYTVQDKKLFYLNFERVGKKAPLLLYVLLVFGWLILMGRNFPAFEYLAKPLGNFFSQDRTIGNYTFSINGLVLFVAIMAISVLVSKIVSFFASDEHLAADKDSKQKKRGLGSWILLVRIFILSIGLFLAIAAAGIPMDRITIVLGALGVGIGFGLQTLVNNLVSGLIIAFEKPVNVGDIVDVDGQGGTMKSIGFRSSVISTWDGADVVMPNGDLLNSHLVNWSLAGNRKRVAIVLGIAYNSDLEKCRRIIVEVLDAEQRINKNPGPVVQYEQFGASTIDLKIYFWAKHIREAYAIRSDLIVAISEAFNANNISIPFPRQDVHLFYPNKEGEEPQTE